MGYTPPMLNISNVGTSISVRGFNSSGTDTYFYANKQDATSLIVIGGNGDITVKPAGTLVIADAAAEIFYIKDDATDKIIQVAVVDKNLFLQTSGTGKVKFGTYDATPALASTGFIPILDAAGNARKLMVQA